MKQQFSVFSCIWLLACYLLLAQRAVAQGYDDPLTIQGIDHTTLQSAASRAAGGTTIGLQNDVGLMFSNPASLQSLKEIQLSVGALQQNTNQKQVQQYSPLKYYSNFSLVMEGLTGYIPNPDTLLGGSDPGDTVQRPYDTIGPNWSRSKNKGSPIQAFLAVPFSIGGMNFAAGAGFVEYANLNHYYQNNNVLSPVIGSDRPVPVQLPPSDSTPVVTNWSSFFRSREGSIRGYCLALSGSLSEGISVGVSGMLLKGTTDDIEQRRARGRFVFYKQWFRLDSTYGRSSATGTSDFSGAEFTFSGICRGRYVSVGFSVKPPATIKRKYTTLMQVVDTTGSSALTVSGEDNIRLPWRGTLGLSILATQNLTLGLEYEIRSYASAVYKNAAGLGSNPWLSSSVIHVGAEYRASPWLALRGGIRGNAEVFEQTGNPIPGEPVSYSIYSTGAGFLFSGIRLNITYEYALMKYQDTWQTNVNLNSETHHGFVADVSYEIPWTHE